ncbi:MAG: hypothetical protein KAS63_00210 [Candidatus Heimdallarchaeota archaeon]|nr:hypothetical protein [Candidatus Heimdallarchaeota archaeon]MCK4953766.1 hypothetical protein [Candidatus Heimdallarchaeota archaeon]
MLLRQVFLIVFAVLLLISSVFVSYFIIRVVRGLKQKNLLSIRKRKYRTIYERMADDQQATEQYMYMRRKLTGG